MGLIVAAGRGTRAGPGTPKQYREIANKQILTRSIEAILAEATIESVLVVIGSNDEPLYRDAVVSITDKRLLPPAIGGATRAESVKNGLLQLEKLQPMNVLIHDAARPFVSTRILQDTLKALDKADGAFPVIPVADAIWDRRDLTPVDRTDLVRAQTPQTFKFDKILKAHLNNTSSAKDDVEVAVAAGLNVAQIEGEEGNFKVTTPEDFERAAAELSTQPDIRVGQGYDVHAFEDGSSLVLNGVEIAFSRTLKGHSDADVAMHAITDAIYGALGKGDIGTWFPPSDPKWKGAVSSIFLEHAVKLANDAGFAISNVDSTIICEEPKIGPHAAKMRATLSDLMGLPIDRISVKATTSERLGFTGRKEGIASMAIVSLIRS